MLVISDPRVIRALASPVRQDVVDGLEAAGPCTVAELAELLGRPADGLYYHLRILERAGILVQSRGPGEDGRKQARYDVAGRPTRLRYEPADRKNVAAVVEVAGGMLRSALRGFRRAFTAGPVVVEGARRNLWASRQTARLSPEELEEVNRLLGRVSDIFSAARGGSPDTPVQEITFVLAPRTPRPARRGEST